MGLISRCLSPDQAPALEVQKRQSSGQGTDRRHGRKSDRRYTWSVDGSSANIYPRETVGNSSYLLNRELDSIALKNVNGPSDALATLSKLVPDEQLGIAGIGMGVNNDYPEPWNAVFNYLTVRQLMNRLSEHSGPRGGWIWSGSKGQRFFAFFERGSICSVSRGALLHPCYYFFYDYYNINKTCVNIAACIT
jgi:hypothetical protein